MKELMEWLNTNRLANCNEFTEDELKTKVYLSLSFWRLNSLPECFVEMKHLRILTLYGNKLVALPECLREFKQLYRLTLSHNKLRTLPDCFCELDKLEEFYFHGNPNLILTQKQADFISSIPLHSPLSNFTIIPDTDLAKDLFL